MIKFSCNVFMTVVMSLISVNASPDECKIRESIKTFMEECSKEHGVTKADIKKAMETGLVEDYKPCYLSCVFKKLGIFNKEGDFDIDTLTSMIPKDVKDEMYNLFVETAKKCTSVNDEPISVGDAGCERAVLLLKCYLEQKKEFLV